MSTYTIKTYNVNSKRLYNDVYAFLDTVITEFSVLWDSETHRDAVIEVIEEFFLELAMEGRITQFNVMCDSRNNNKQLADNGIVNLTVSYKQVDCYNTTRLDYVIIEDKDN